MKKLLISTVIVFTLASNTFLQALILNPELVLRRCVTESDLIVIGTLNKSLRQPSVKSRKVSDYKKFEIVVDQVIARDIKTDKKIRVKTNDKLPINDIYDTFSKIENEKQIFLLNFNKSGELEPPYYYPLVDLAKIEEFLKNDLQTSKPLKIITIRNTESRSSQPLSANPAIEGHPFAFDFQASKQKEYSPFQALLVILSSISLYYLLYRSKFKII